MRFDEWQSRLQDRANIPTKRVFVNSQENFKQAAEPDTDAMNPSPAVKELTSLEMIQQVEKYKPPTRSSGREFDIRQKGTPTSMFTQRAEKNRERVLELYRSQRKTNDFRTQVKQYFARTPLEKFNLGLRPYLEAFKKYMYISPDEIRQIEDMIRRDDPKILSDDSIAPKVAMSQTLLAWFLSFLDNMGRAQTAVAVPGIAVTAVHGFPRISEVMRHFIDKVISVFRRMGRRPPPGLDRFQENSYGPLPRLQVEEGAGL